ncbi:MAG TPA: hypothetical protein VEF53_16230 [Patescibacteria group bacterium]|nr:hypothetical protein [Patescibacteria group bacterium]
MFDNYYYTINKICPCKIDNYAVKQAADIFKMSSDAALFTEEMNRKRIVGKRIWYDEKEHTIFVTKISAYDSGGGCPENDSLIGRCCHCDYYNRSTEYYPKHFCKCAAEFYRPIFALLFGENVLIEPHTTVLSGDEQCAFAIRLNRKENKE